VTKLAALTIKKHVTFIVNLPVDFYDGNGTKYTVLIKLSVCSDDEGRIHASTTKTHALSRIRT